MKLISDLTPRELPAAGPGLSRPKVLRIASWVNFVSAGMLLITLCLDAVYAPYWWLLTFVTVVMVLAVLVGIRARRVADRLEGWGW